MRPARPTPLCLVVDDDPIQRAVSVRMLESMGWTTAEAGDGEAAIVETRSLDPDLILMDLQMPVLDGWGAVGRIRARSEHGGWLPVVACTTQGDVTEAQLRSAGFDGLLRKPIDAKELAAVVDTWSPSALHRQAQNLRSLFTSSELDQLWQGLSDQLRALLSETDAVVAQQAHRIAGLAGTLGFVDLGKRWLAVSEGDLASAPSARRMARTTVARIAAHIGSAAKH